MQHRAYLQPSEAVELQQVHITQHSAAGSLAAMQQQAVSADGRSAGAARAGCGAAAEGLQQGIKPQNDELPVLQQQVRENAGGAQHLDKGDQQETAEVLLQSHCAWLRHKTGVLHRLPAKANRVMRFIVTTSTRAADKNKAQELRGQGATPPQKACGRQQQQ